MKTTTSFYSMIQQCQVQQIFDFLYFVVTQKEEFISEINIIMICQISESVRPLQKKKVRCLRLNELRFNF